MTHQEDIALIESALNSNNPDQRRIARVGIDFVATLLRKNHDYGGSQSSPASG